MAERIILPVVPAEASGGDRNAYTTDQQKVAAQCLHNKENPKFRVLSYGCQMNAHEAETMSGLLEQMGYRETDNTEEADMLLLNTCSIRENAVEKILGKVGELKALKLRNPDMMIGVCGCMPQHPGEAERLQKHAPHLDMIFGTMNLHRLPDLIQQARVSPTTVVELVDDPGAEVVEGLPALRKDGLKAWVTIIHGCDKFCTYCVVPYTRGRERSRQPEAVYREVAALAAEGYKEVTLLGQNVDSFGKDLQPPTSFAKLLQRLDTIEGLERIRFTTSHPRDFTQELIDTIAGSKHVCEHIHLPFQAGSNRVLAAMKREYTREIYLDLIRRIKAAIPGVALTTDIIVGFPGETAEEFEETLDLVRQVRFDGAFTFVYSPRNGTPAARMDDPVPLEEKKERLQRLMAVQNEISLEINRALLGRTVEVLVEGPSKKDPSVMAGRTRTNKLVTFAAPESSVGQLVQVEITQAGTWTLAGRLAGDTAQGSAAAGHREEMILA